VLSYLRWKILSKAKVSGDSFCRLKHQFKTAVIKEYYLMTEMSRTIIN
jgi:hypothetical protein